MLGGRHRRHPPAGGEGDQRRVVGLLGTTNAGTSWSRVTFSVPAGSPDYEGQSFLSAGDISCPSVGACAANGEGAPSSPTTPIYALRISSDAT